MRAAESPRGVGPSCRSPAGPPYITGSGPVSERCTAKTRWQRPPAAASLSPLALIFTVVSLSHYLSLWASFPPTSIEKVGCEYPTRTPPNPVHGEHRRIRRLENVILSLLSPSRTRYSQVMTVIVEY
ncbi:hypothetical protein BV25DRAFT_1603228 [Artomyces pyxidatus]|uniref:Uncharacterized protein n=1 Tax=Artomyces pyxidatus TaxID=48021 RepID=A0ACB8TBI8_9AGAM|nr:hypothetical protein BV25DRAFT_1603228 [Artomyces pyxidatus]